MKYNDNTKFELAREIMNAMIGNACKHGFDENSPEIQKLLDEEKEMNNFNMKIVDKIIRIYGPNVKRG